MQTIYKYPLAPRTTLDIPRDATLLCVQMQGNEPMLWVLLETLAPAITRRFYAVATGEEIVLSVGAYIGTWQDHGMVFHLFEERS